jgi:Xaa-Pro aminopeptidase
MNEKVIAERLRAVHKHLKKDKIDCLVLTNPANVTYLTGFLGDESWAVVTSRGAYLVTDSRYRLQAASECKLCRIVERKDSLAEGTTQLIRGLKSVRNVSVDKSISLAYYLALKKHLKGGIKKAPDIVEGLRCIKDQSEIRTIEAACRIAERALSQVKRYVKAGVSENELASRLDFQIRRLGAINCFETIVAFGANAARPHHKPTTRKLKKNDTVLVDFGVRYKGYCCDLTRCFAVGRVSGLYKKAYGVVEQAKAAAIEAIKPGVDVRDVDSAARWVIKRSGLPVYGHGTGHGLGLQVHEAPVISDKVKGRLQAGMVFTVEPAVYIGGKFGIRLEEDVLVTQADCKILSGY